MFLETKIRFLIEIWNTMVQKCFKKHVANPSPVRALSTAAILGSGQVLFMAAGLSVRPGLGTVFNYNQYCLSKSRFKNTDILN